MTGLRPNRSLKELLDALPKKGAAAVDWEALQATALGPVFDRMARTEQNPLYHGEGNVFIHTQQVCESLLKLSDYQKEMWDRDIITHIRIAKGQCAAVHSVRVSETDIPVLVCTAAKSQRGVRVVLGARPARAVIVADGLSLDNDQRVYEEIAEKTAFGTNLRASEAYRRKIAPVLMARCVKDLKEV